jgi:hypothetical protein
MKSSKSSMLPNKPEAPPPPIIKNGRHSRSDLVRLVIQELTKGAGAETILEYLTARGDDLPGLTRKKALQCLAAARQELAAARLPAAYQRGLANAAYLMLYEKLVATGDYAGAIKAMDRWVALNHLGEPEKPKPPKTVSAAPPSPLADFSLED